MVLSAEAQRILAEYEAYKQTIVDRDSGQTFLNQLEAEQQKAIIVLANAAVDTRSLDQFTSQFAADILNSPTLQEIVADRTDILRIDSQQEIERIADASRTETEASEAFVYDDSISGQVSIKDGSYFAVENTDRTINVQQAEIIRIAQEQFFNDLSRDGRYVIPTQEQEIALLEAKKVLKDLLVEKVNIEKPFLDLIQLRIDDAVISVERFNQQIAEAPKGSKTLITKKRDEFIGRNNKNISQDRGNMNQALTTILTEINVAENIITKIEDERQDFADLTFFRLGIINDINQFKLDSFIDSVEKQEIQDLVQQGSEFISNIIQRDIAIPQSEIRELQLAMLDASAILRGEFIQQLEDTTDDITTRTSKPISVFQPTEPIQFQDTLGGVLRGENVFANDLAQAFTTAFNPPLPQLIEMFVNSAKAQQAAAEIIQSESN